VDSPTVLRRRLGSELRKMRDGKGLTGAHIAKQLGWSESKVSRIESGKSPLSDKDAKLLLAMYGVQDAQEIRQFTALVRKSRQPGWWHAFGDALPDWFRAYVGFESDASQIRTYQNELVPGLLQTEDYARAVIRSMNAELSVDEIERRATARIQRQDILTREHPPRVWAILNESVVRRVIGSPAIMQAQLKHIAEVAETHPNVTVQILPFDAGAHASMGYSFLILSFDDIPGSVAYSEGPTSATYMDRPADLNRHEEIFQQLMASATRPEKSVAWMKEIADGHRHER